jgi:hypothetical protein
MFWIRAQRLGCNMACTCGRHVHFGMSLCCCWRLNMIQVGPAERAKHSSLFIECLYARAGALSPTLASRAKHQQGSSGRATTTLCPFLTPAVSSFSPHVTIWFVRDSRCPGRPGEHLAGQRRTVMTLVYDYRHSSISTYKITSTHAQDRDS